MANTPRDGFQSMPAEQMMGVGAGDQTGEVKQAEELAAGVSMAMEFGTTGLKRSAGWIDEEFLPQLRGRKSVQVFKEMNENDPLVGALMFTIQMLLRNVEWTVKPGGKGKQDRLAAELLETSMDDMEHTWDEFISEVLTMLVYGWSWHEVVYKRRQGVFNPDPRGRSKYNDGLIAWRKMPIRAQETLFKWVFDDNGDVKALVQIAPPNYTQRLIPYERSLLFRFQQSKGNPEGRSLLRNAYRPWYMKKRIEEFEAVGVERDLAGLPMVKVPAEWLRAKAGSDQRKAVEGFKKMVKSIRRDEQEGLVFPVQYDQDTKQPLFDFQLLGSGGTRAFQTDGIIQRYEQRILMTVLADFIMVGHESVGSYSLHTDKTGIFRTALNAIADAIAQVLNRRAVPRLIRLNGFKVIDMPEFVPQDVDAPDISQLSAFMSQMAGMGVQWFPDADLEKFVRQVARLPERDEASQEVEQVISARAQARRFMESQMQMDQVQQQIESMQAAASRGEHLLPQPQQPGQAGGPAQPGAVQPGQQQLPAGQ